MERIRVSGAAPGDEIFSSSGLATFNITRIKAAYQSNPERFKTEVSDITQELVDFVRKSHDPLDLYVNAITAEELQRRYIISVELTEKESDPEDWAAATKMGAAMIQMVDGTHALLAAARLGVKTIRNAIVPIGIRRCFEVRHEIVRDGAWRLISPDEVVELTTGLYVARDGRRIDRR